MDSYVVSAKPFCYCRGKTDFKADFFNFSTGEKLLYFVKEWEWEILTGYDDNGTSEV
jgi:hypothetical protein